MAKIILDIPKNKMQSIIKTLIGMGIDSHAINRVSNKKRYPSNIPLSSTLKKISSSFILFDWEFFSNELEYE